MKKVVDVLFYSFMVVMILWIIGVGGAVLMMKLIPIVGQAQTFFHPANEEVIAVSERVIKEEDLRYNELVFDVSETDQGTTFIFIDHVVTVYLNGTVEINHEYPVLDSDTLQRVEVIQGSDYVFLNEAGKYELVEEKAFETREVAQTYTLTQQYQDALKNTQLTDANRVY